MTYNLQQIYLIYKREETLEVSCPKCGVTKEAECLATRNYRGKRTRTRSHQERWKELHDVRRGKKQETTYNFPVETRRVEATRVDTPAKRKLLPAKKPKRKLT